MTGGNAAAAHRDIDLPEVMNSDEISPLQIEQIIATRIDHNEEKDNGQQNEKRKKRLTMNSIGQNMTWLIK